MAVFRPDPTSPVGAHHARARAWRRGYSEMLGVDESSSSQAPTRILLVCDSHPGGR